MYIYIYIKQLEIALTCVLPKRSKTKDSLIGFTHRYITCTTHRGARALYIGNVYTLKNTRGPLSYRAVIKHRDKNNEGKKKEKEKG